VLTTTLFHSSVNPRISLGFGTIYLTDILLIVNLLLIGIRSFVESDFRIVKTPLDKPLLLFVGMALFATFIAIIYTPLKLRSSLHEMRIVSNYLVFFVVTNHIRDEKQQRFLINGFILLATIVGGAMILQYVLGPSVPIIPGRVEVLKTAGERYSGVTRIIPPGYLMPFISFVLLSVILLSDDVRNSNRGLLIPWALAAIGVLLTFKRQLWIGALLTFPLIALFTKRRNLSKLVRGSMTILFVAVPGFLFLYAFTGDVGPKLINSSLVRLTSLTNYDDPNSTLSHRSYEYDYAFPQIAAHPLLGLGLGSRYRPLVPGRDWEKYDGRAYMHNSYLWIVVKAGLLSFLPFLLLILRSLYRGFKYWRSVPDTRQGLYVLGFTLAFFLVLTTGSWASPALMEWGPPPAIGVMLGINELILKRTNLTRPSFYQRKVV
ncbi:MAG: hypothetical protein B6243_05355, partial [Anaerolineaceae bacterium 4572_5.2]